MSEKVLVFEKTLLTSFPQTPFIDDTQILTSLLERAKFMNRDEAETDPFHKQFIVYAILRYNGSVLRYKRSAKGYESRLRGSYSIGVGGHINENDDLPLYTTLYTNLSLIEEARDREVKEEFSIQSSVKPRLIGLLNDDSNEVGKVHFGVIYEYWLDNPDVESREKRSHLQHRFIPIPELINSSHEYENWSRIIIDNYLVSQVLISH